MFIEKNKQINTKYAKKKERRATKKELMFLRVSSPVQSIIKINKQRLMSRYWHEVF